MNKNEDDSLTLLELMEEGNKMLKNDVEELVDIHNYLRKLVRAKSDDEYEMLELFASITKNDFRIRWRCNNYIEKPGDKSPVTKVFKMSGTDVYRFYDVEHASIEPWEEIIFEVFEEKAKEYRKTKKTNEEIISRYKKYCIENGKEIV